MSEGKTMKIKQQIPREGVVGNFVFGCELN